jgi:hypothetical protein
MECSLSPAPTAMAVAPAAALPVTPGGLAAAFAAAPDPRRQASVDYPLPAILTLAVAAILSAHPSVLAIAEWGARQERDLLAWLGFPEGRTPCQSTVQRLFRKLDGHALAGALSAHFAPAVAPAPAEPGAAGVAIDGKAQRGRLQYQTGGSPVHALTAFCHEHGGAWPTSRSSRAPTRARRS